MQPWLQHWVLGGGLVDAIIVITLLEAAALAAYHHQTKRGLKPRDYLFNMASGLCLMLALRSSLSGSAWYWIALWLTAAGLIHVADLVLRFQQRSLTNYVKRLS